MKKRLAGFVFFVSAFALGPSVARDQGTVRALDVNRCDCSATIDMYADHQQQEHLGTLENSHGTVPGYSASACQSFCGGWVSDWGDEVCSTYPAAQIVKNWSWEYYVYLHPNWLLASSGSVGPQPYACP